ncbi:helix-turn-helix transcriptional regulator [Pedobacter sp. N36a]|uniref:helix-turn-helix domain-containing protein n=1 Tax=Pedobacter sp. N36a TaxID=2767996 RepID=UPI001657137E|nr:helix-turn-helix transcriptional regulator [Pedobacter sp. N36a]MBC8987559.1 helix-turn-helix transcriptional regulator [Pedobacter sp. N36a]
MATKNPRNEKVIKQFGINVRKFRELKGLKMVELAVLCEVEYGTISTIERGLVNCTISTAHSVAKALEVTMDQLFED